tara:strand:+ start:406 stop:822 length:417 start_codon:yes stop_codon:yes gene_type:complete
MSNNNRPTWDDYFKEIVTITSKRSSCTRLNVGCLLIKNNRIISQGYNGHLPGLPHESIMEDNHEIATIHAEQNALVDCAKRGASCDECTAYITHYPCVNCTKLLLAAGIKKIKYIHDYSNNENVGVFCSKMNVTINKI